VTLPSDASPIVEDDLAQMMNGSVDVLNAAGAALVGGHTAEGAELSLGFALTGIADPARLWRKGGLQERNALILTKPLGTGTLLAADMRANAKGPDVAAAIESMLQSPAEAAHIFAAHDARACTDVTGFGLAGHLLEMLRASNVSAKLDISALRLLPGALDAMGAGYFSTLHPENFKYRRFIDGVAPDILFDPQTAGPLLAGVPRERASDCIAALHAAGYEQAALIGEIGASAAGEVKIITK
jgi:selenide,water dikinase